MKYKKTETYIEDADGNRCRFSFFGGKENAKEALKSLRYCSDCSDCSYCSGCRSCSSCRDCSDCSSCSSCSDCRGCSSCSDCRDCSGCSSCGSCSYCRSCRYCRYCSYCREQKNPKPNIPKIENIHQLVFEAARGEGSLDMSDWHTCDTTHCRAGWVVFLSGEKGKELEDRFDTTLAAMMIYDESSKLEKISPVRFFETNEVALGDMKRMAKLEKAEALTD